MTKLDVPMTDHTKPGVSTRVVLRERNVEVTHDGQAVGADWVANAENG
jgi:hypothetical protein